MINTCIILENQNATLSNTNPAATEIDNKKQIDVNRILPAISYFEYSDT